MNGNEIGELKTAFDKLAHDVRSPLTSIAGFTRLLLEDASVQGENREYLTIIESDVDRLTKLLTDGFEQIDKRLSLQ